MREIKFRAFHENLNVKKSNEYMDYSSSCESLSRFFAENRDTNLCKCHIMQYTGLRDKNNKEIYESDIVVYQSEKFVVEYDEKQGSFGFKNENVIFIDFYDMSISSLVEVIGNIFENPELIEG